MAFTTWRGSVTVLIALHGRSMPSDEEWRRYFEAGKQLYAPGADLSRVRALNLTDGGAPSARQREQIREHMGDRELYWAIVTTSRFARGVATALGWFYPRFKAFAPQDFHRATRFLGIPEGEVESLWEAILDADRDLRTQTVAEIASVGPMTDVLG
jgi:hypothetical protein